MTSRDRLSREIRRLALGVFERRSDDASSEPVAGLALETSRLALVAHFVAQKLSLLVQRLEGVGGPMHPDAAPDTERVDAPLSRQTDEQTPPSIQDHGVSSEIQLGAKSSRFAPEQQRSVEALLARYEAKTKTSKGLARRNRIRVADPAGSVGFSLSLKDAVYPVIFGRSSGCRAWDVDGNEYVDLVSGRGSNLFGCAALAWRDAMKQQIDLGMESAARSALVAPVALGISELAACERLALCGNESEALMGALRLARTVTGKKRIVLFDGSGHGLADELYVRADGFGGAVSLTRGVPSSALHHVIALEYGSLRSIEVVREHEHDIAAVLVDPTQAAESDVHQGAFLRELRAVTEANRIALVFDETRTGLGCVKGGAQEFFDVRADMVIYGSSLAGGLPFGVIAGRSTYLDAVDGGAWKYGDTSFPEADTADFADRRGVHPLVLSAALSTLEQIELAGPSFHENLADKARRFVASLDSWLSRAGRPITLRAFGSMVFVGFSADALFRELLYLELRTRGVHASPDSPLVFSAAHTDDDVAFVAEQFKRALNELSLGGFISKPSVDPLSLAAPVSGARLGRDENGNPAWFVPDPNRPGSYQLVEVAP